MALLKVLLLLGLGVSVNSDVSLQKRIIGGKKCDDKDRLYHVRITVDDEFQCGGSLIHPQWILTAAHCWEWHRGLIMEAVLRVHPGTAKQKEIITHPPVVYIDKKGQQHDIMLLKLQTEVKDITPVPLPDCKNRPKKGDSVQLAGEAATTTGRYCGKTKTGPFYERVTAAPIPVPHLQCVDMKVDDCPPIFKSYFGDESIFCVQEAGKDISPGDSGGGVIFKGKIYGVNSAIGKFYACKLPAFIMDVCEYIDWIRQTTGLVKT